MIRKPIKYPEKNRGFTLIELMVVLSIVTLLASIVLGPVNAARHRARDTERIQTLHQIQNALELYRSDHGYYPYGTAYSPWSRPGICSPAPDSTHWKNCDDDHGDPMGDLISGGYISAATLDNEALDGGNYLAGGYATARGYVYCSGNSHGNCFAYKPDDAFDGISDKYVLGTNLERPAGSPPADDRWGNFQLHN